MLLEYIPQHTQFLLMNALEETSIGLRQLQSSFIGTGGRLGVRSRLKWTLVEKGPVETAQKRLETVKCSLMLVLQLLDLRLSTLSQASLINIQAAQRTIEGQMQQSVGVRRAEPQAIHIITEIADETGKGTGQIAVDSGADTTHDHAEITRSIISRKSVMWKTNDSRQFFPSQHANSAMECWGKASITWDDKQSTYTFSSQVRFPWWLGQRALVLELKIRQYALSWTSLSLLSGYITLCGYQPSEARVVRACLQGDESTVRNQLLARVASPNDFFQFDGGNRKLIQAKLYGFDDDEMTLLTVCISFTFIVDLTEFGCRLQYYLETCHLLRSLSVWAQTSMLLTGMVTGQCPPAPHVRPILAYTAR